MLLLLQPALAFAQERLDDWPLAETWASTPEGYFESPAAAEFFDRYVGDDGLEDLLDPPTAATALLYVPPGQPPFGVMVHIAAEDSGVLPSGWREALDAANVVYVAPHGVGNAQPTVIRATRALDALASVEAGYDIDPDRVLIGGFSGGAAIAVMVMAHWPEPFRGVIDECRAVMWEEHEIASIPGSIFGMGEVDHLDPEFLAPLVGGPRFAFVTGDEDVLPTSYGPFLNYEGILDGIGDWWDRGIRARVWDVPGQAHGRAGGQAFASALSWVLDCSDDGLYPARFDTDHLPPHTPFPTPGAPPPEVCDPVAPGAEGGAEGCGCRSVGTGGWLGLAAALGFGATRGRKTQPLGRGLVLAQRPRNDNARQSRTPRAASGGWCPCSPCSNSNRVAATRAHIRSWTRSPEDRASNRGSGHCHARGETRPDGGRGRRAETLRPPAAPAKWRPTAVARPRGRRRTPA